MVWTSDSDTPQLNERQRIAALEATVADLQQRLTALEGASEVSPAAASSSPYGTVAPAVNDAVDPWSVAPWPEIVSLILGGKKIQAIKVYREYFSVGLINRVTRPATLTAGQVNGPQIAR